ncbi:MAG: type II toxin-antitoxin system RelB/DinJ family antitoxin [Patescibacteria group bacterium]|jgi:DNA-damage-inducible protein J
MTTIQVRIDNKTKATATKVLDKIGLDMSTAIKIYLHQVIINQGVPLKLVTANGFSVAAEDEILQAVAEAKLGENVTKSMSAQQAVKHLKKL